MGECAEEEGFSLELLLRELIGELDTVYVREDGVGVVDEVLAPEYPYPITVKWTEDGTYSTFTLEGHYYPQRADAEKDIKLVKEEDIVGCRK